MRIDAPRNRPVSAKLFVRDIVDLESAQGVLAIIARNFPGDRLGESATVARDGIATVLDILTAAPPKKLEAK